jgi:low temperature requirement protein LtrA
MTGRDSREAHRASTPLELFFDLCFVVAVGLAAGRLAHAVEVGRVGHGLLGYVLIFYAIWWAWMGFTWFASAYDTDDVPYRIATFVQIAGALVIAAGVPRAFESIDYTVVVAGYVIMRVALLSQWLRVVRDDPVHRTAAARWSGGVALAQIGWVLALWTPTAWHVTVFGLLIVAELSVPAWSVRAGGIEWHPHHIAERYGLFTLIVLGESVSAATVAVQSALETKTAQVELLPLALGGLLMVFSAWWIYFAAPAGRYLAEGGPSMLWGYGHYLIFASAAAIGAGLEVAAGQASGQVRIPVRTADAAVTVPGAVFLFTVWLLHARFSKRGIGRIYLPAAAVLTLACTFAGKAGVLLAGAVAAATVMLSAVTAARQALR